MGRKSWDDPDDDSGALPAGNHRKAGQAAEAHIKCADALYGDDFPEKPLGSLLCEQGVEKAERREKGEIPDEFDA